jgi:hypothetical protein
MVNIINKEMVRGGYVKKGSMPRERGRIEKAGAGIEKGQEMTYVSPFSAVGIRKESFQSDQERRLATKDLTNQANLNCLYRTLQLRCHHYQHHHHYHLHHHH